MNAQASYASSILPSTDDSSLLRTVLRENAIYSGITGLAAAATAWLLDDRFGVNPWMLVGLGVGLAMYAVSLWAGTKSKTRETGVVAVAGDVGWLVGVVALVAATDWLTRTGEVTLLVVSIPVLAFAIGQAIGLRRIGA